MSDDPPILTSASGWDDLRLHASRAAIEAILPAYIHPRRWFGAKSRQIASARIVEALPIETSAGPSWLMLVRLTYADGAADTYALPLASAAGDVAERLRAETPHAILAGAPGERVLFDASFAPAFCQALLDMIASRRTIEGEAGELCATTTSAFARLRGATPLEPSVGKAEQSNTSIIYGDRLIMKLFRKLEPGLNPDLEIGRFLTERGAFEHIPPLAGAIEYRAGGDTIGLALLQGFVPNRGDAWRYTIETLARWFERALAAGAGAPPAETRAAPMLDLASQEPPPAARELISGYLASAELLGRRTAELHLALSADASDPDFAPEPWAEQDRRAVYETMRRRAEHSFQILRHALGGLSAPAQPGAQQVLDRESAIFDRLQSALDRPIEAARTRIHGDYHLGQVLYTGSDFFIIDFEGEPARPLSERRSKSSPLQDVAGMLRSFHYAPYAVLLGQAPGVAFRDADVAALEPWARYWQRWVGAAFLRSYLATAGGAPFLPASRGDLQGLLDAYLLDKAVYELAYELNNRPTWVRIPVEGILQLVARG